MVTLRGTCTRLGVVYVLLGCAAGFKIMRSGPEEEAQAVRDVVCEDLEQYMPSHRPGRVIVEENCKEGVDASEWDINGAGHPSIQGFANSMSYLPESGVVELRIKTEATSYRIDIYRVGYYQGKGARLVARDIPKVIEPPHNQPSCELLEEEALLVDCLNWDVNALWMVPEDAVSGVYFARLTRTDMGPRDAWRTDASSVTASPKFANPEWDYSTPPPCGWPPAEGEDASIYNACVAQQQHADVGAAKWRKGSLMANALQEPFASHVIFVVKENRHHRTSEMVFQTSDTTWHAYNNYGTPNTYGVHALPHHLEYFPFTEDIAFAKRRSYKRSYNVPLLTRDIRSVNMLWQCEYPMIRWLERNGYDVSYIAGKDARGEVLLDWKVFLSVGHDEYWSLEQRAAVEKARDRGVHLAFLSGNEMYWQIRWENEEDPVDHGQHRDHDLDDHLYPNNYRVMVVYKETQASAKLDPEPFSWTGTWRDNSAHNRRGGRPENSVTGQLWTVNSWRNDALVIPHPYNKLRFWRHTRTGEAELSEGDSVVLMKGLLGHEWDSDVDNGHRPRGLVRLSETTYNNVNHIIDAGASFDSGTATHHLVMYKAASGSIVFGAGTLQWMWGLDPHHDSPGGVPNYLENAYSTRIGYDVTGPEPCIEQATVNLFEDMGVEPGVPDPRYILTGTGECEAVLRTPVCSITSVKVEGRNVTITGTAETLQRGRLVAAVEVTLDHTWWHPVNTRLAAASVEWVATFEHSSSFHIHSDNLYGENRHPHVESYPLDPEHAGLLPACRATDDCLNTGIEGIGAFDDAGARDQLRHDNEL